MAPRRLWLGLPGASPAPSQHRGTKRSYTASIASAFPWRVIVSKRSLFLIAWCSTFCSASCSAASMSVSSQVATSSPCRHFTVTSAIFLYLSSVRMMCAVADRSTTFAMRASPASVCSFNLAEMVVCRPVYSTFMRFTSSTGCVMPSSHPALVGAGNVHVLTVFRDRAARYLDALTLQLGRQIFVCPWLARVFVFNQFAHPPLQQRQWKIAALRPVHPLGKEITQLVHALRRVNIFVGNCAAHRRRMHPDLFRHILDHHRPQRIDAALQKIDLPPYNHFARPHDRVLPLLDIAQQLDCRFIPLFHVLAHVALGFFLAQHLAVTLVQPQRGQVLFIHHDDVLVIALHKCHVRLDQPRLRLVVALPRPRIEPANEIHRFLHLVGGPAAHPRQLAHVFLLQERKAFLHDERRRIVYIERRRALRRRLRKVRLALVFQRLSRHPAAQHQRMLAALRLHLQQQAFAQIASPYADRVKLCHHTLGLDNQRLRFDRRHRTVSTRKLVEQRAGQLLLARRQVAILIQVADH